MGSNSVPLIAPNTPVAVGSGTDTRLVRFEEGHKAMTTADAGTGPNGKDGGTPWREAKGALVIVLAGVGAIVLLAVAALLILGLQLESSSATVSVATSAFGVVGSIVGAYFGVKIGSEQAADATGQNADLTKRVQAAETKADAYALHVDDADAAQKTAQDMLRAVQSAV